MLDREACLKEFIEAFDANRDPEFWKKLIDEEANEVLDALACLLKELEDLSYVLTGYAVCGGEDDKIPMSIIGKLMISHDARLLFLGEISNKAFRRVHESNMSKLGDGGKPIRREDGKILKGPNYKPPYLLDLITN